MPTEIPLPSTSLAAAVRTSPAFNGGNVLDQLESWLDLDGIIRDVVVEHYPQLGILLSGARERRFQANKHPAFEEPWPAIPGALEVLIKHGGRLRYSDEHGVSWWVKLSDDPGRSDHWRGVAIGNGSLPWMVDSAGRDRYRAQLAREWSQLRTSSDQPLRSRNCWFRKLMLYVDGAARLVPTIYLAAVQDDQHRVLIAHECLAAGWWGPDPTCWPRGWKAKVNNALSILSGINVRVWKVPKNGQFPTITDRRSAVSRAVCRKRKFLDFQVSAEFMLFAQDCMQSASHNPSPSANK